jgi:hypothetical protein
MKKQNKAHINKWIKQLGFTQTLLGEGAFSQIAIRWHSAASRWCADFILDVCRIKEGVERRANSPAAVPVVWMPDYTCIGYGLVSKIVSKASAWLKLEDANAVALWTGRAASTWRWGDALRVCRCRGRSQMVDLPWQMQTVDAAGERPPHNADVLPFPELLVEPWTPRPRVERGRKRNGRGERNVCPTCQCWFLSDGRHKRVVGADVRWGGGSGFTKF